MVKFEIICTYFKLKNFINELPISIFEKPGIKALISKLTVGLAVPQIVLLQDILVTAKKKKIKQLKVELQKYLESEFTPRLLVGCGFLCIIAHYAMKNTDNNLTLEHRNLDFQ